MKNEFCERLEELMEERSLSSLSLSKKIGINHTTILKWKKGLVNPTIDKIAILCDFFGVTPNYLLGLED